MRALIRAPTKVRERSGRDRRPATVVLILAIVSVLAPGEGWAAPMFETPPVLEVGQFVAPWALQGPRYRVDARVPTDGFQARFTINSDFGKFEALGVELLAVRLAEVVALDKLESVSKTELFVKAAASAVARPVPSAGTILLNPVETPAGSPAGVGGLFERAPLAGQQITDVTADPSKGAGDDGGAAGQMSASILGWEQERRRLAKDLKVDPYTTNPVLAKRLDDVAWVSFTGGLGVNVVLSATTAFSLVIGGTSRTRDLVWDTPAPDLINRNREHLRAMGVDDTAITGFFKNRSFSLSGQTALVDGLESLPGVAGRSDVVALAAKATSGDEGRFLVSALQILNRYREQGGPVEAIQALGRTLSARTPGGGLLIVAPVDYVSWTKKLDEFARRPELQAVKERNVWITGRLSPRAKHELGRLGWITKEDVLPAK